MATLSVSLGQYSDKGRKTVNQDFHGAYLPKEPLLSSKGIAIALADGISSSQVSQIASQAAVTGFLADYFCTSEAWSVKKSAQQVLNAINSWLYAQTRHSHCYDKNRGYVCTFSGLVLKSNTLHIFHIGDARIYRLYSNRLEQLTEDHRFWTSREESYLARALGITQQLEIDYQTQTLEQGDIFLLATDGVYDYLTLGLIQKTINDYADHLDKAAKILVEHAYAQGSDDNLTLQLVRIDQLPPQNTGEISQQLNELPFAPLLEARMVFDGYKIIREVHASSRSHVYLAEDMDNHAQVILQTPSIDLRDDKDYLERFLMEDWIAQRLSSPYVLKPYPLTRKRHYLYTVTEFIDGQTLKQWLIDNPKPDLETVRTIVEQIAKGLRAFHRMEMLHQDLRPDNTMIERTGTAKILDFGSTRVAGVIEAHPKDWQNLLGTAQYTAPGYFLGESGSPRSDLFSLAVITYQMLSGQLPYGLQAAKARTRMAQMKLDYEPVLYHRRDLPAWIDQVLKKALHPNPYKRHADVAEFTYELRHPSQASLIKTRPPLLERDPVAFWKGVSLLLTLIILFLLSQQNI